jgi:hypothetical protein
MLSLSGKASIKISQGRIGKIEDELDVSYRVVVDGVWSLNDHSLIHSLEARKMKILSIEEESWRKKVKPFGLSRVTKILNFFINLWSIEGT